MAHISTTHSGEGIARADSGERTVTVATPLSLQAYWILRVGFILVPLIAGVDKFFNALVNWELYLAPWVVGLLNIDATTIMQGVGVIEIAAGLGVALFPRFFAYVVAAWLLAIIINLLSIPAYYDIALRDAGLMLGALALGRLSHLYAHAKVETAPPGARV